MPIQEINIATKEQADEILSNFPISGGINWENKTFQTTAPIVADHQTNVLLDVAGSGYFLGIYSTVSHTAFWCIEIDGGSIYQIRHTSGNPGTMNFFPLRFNNSIKLSCSTSPTTDLSAWVVLD